MKCLHTSILYAGITVSLLISGSILAQTPQMGRSIRGGATLTEEQSAELQKARMERQKKQTETQLLVTEKRARLNTLQVADKTDMRAINSVIDEIASLQAAQMKANAAFQNTYRNMLTPEQRVTYDATHLRGLGTQGRGQMQGFGQKQGRGQMQDFGQRQGRSQMQGFGQRQGRGQMQGPVQGRMRMTPSEQ